MQALLPPTTVRHVRNYRATCSVDSEMNEVGSSSHPGRRARGSTVSRPVCLGARSCGPAHASPPPLGSPWVSPGLDNAGETTLPCWAYLPGRQELLGAQHTAISLSRLSCLPLLDKPGLHGPGLAAQGGLAPSSFLSSSAS